jgi:pimeloyl-ACP methyl ester carboxylesterase
MSISEELGQLRTADLPQGRITYRERGTGEPIVFVHGVLVNGDLWRHVVPRLADRYRCITPDWPLGAHSEPMKPGADLSTPGLARIVADFLDELSLDGVTLVGNDTGGAVSQLVVTEHPRRVGRLVLASCDAFEVYPPSPFSFLRWIGRIPAAPALVSHSLKLRPLRRLPLAFGWVTSNPLPREISDSYVKPGYRADIRRDTKRLLNGITNRDTLRAAERFGEVDVPVLVAWADDDKLFPQELADRLAAAFPNARRETIAGSRTFIGEDQPDQLADAIRAFIADTPPPDARRAALSRPADARE